MVNRIKGLAASLVLLGLLAGVPAVLLALSASPGFFPNLARLRIALTSPDDGRLLVVLVWILAWIAWVLLAGLVLNETVAIMRGIKAPRIPALSLPQGLIRTLVITAALLFVSTPLAPAPAHAEAPTEPSDHATADAADEVVVTVGPGDTLWGYADEHLDDAHRWPEIFEANKGVPQLDGSALRDPDVILDGWQLTIPPDDPAPTLIDSPAAPPADEVSVTVAEGDTLWRLAEIHLGDPQRWPEIFAANHGVPQPGGGALSDPDVIDVGWTLTIPTTRPPAIPAEPDHRPHEEVVEQAPQQEPNRTPTQTADPTPAEPSSTATQTSQPTSTPPTVTPETGPDDRAEEQGDAEVLDQAVAVGASWHVAGLLGAGVFLGAGVLTVLNRLRRDQFRRRQPGLTIAAPDQTVAPIEMTAGLAAGLSAHRLNRVDTILHRTATSAPTVPRIEALGVTRDGTLIAHCQGHLPPPWESTGSDWTLPAATLPDDIGIDGGTGPSPYPLLVTIGADDQGTTWLVNLEALGIVEVSGDETMRADFLRYLAAELATNPWSSRVHVACLGIATEATAMAPGRFHTDLDYVTGLVKANLDRTERAAVEAPDGRLLQAEEEEWPAVAVITDEQSAARELRDLTDRHPRRGGAAIVTCSPVGGALHLSPAGRVTGLRLDLVAVGLTADEAAGCALLLSAVDDQQPGQPMPERDNLTDLAGNLNARVALPRTQTRPPGLVSLLPEPDADYLEVAAVTVEDLQLLAPDVPEEVSETILQRDPELDQDVRDWFSERCSRPRLTWLGPVQARCHGRPPAKSKAYYTEVLSFLAAHPDGVTNEELIDAFSITADRGRTIISNLRQWVGINPATSRPHIPDAKTSRQAQARGVGLYLVEDLLTDADLFRRLRTRALARGAEGIEDLETALKLVQGRPFSQLRPGGWTWLATGDRIDHHITCAIGDVAHTLVTHHLHAKDLDKARQIAGLGLTVCPESETAALDLASIMVAEGNTTTAHQLIADVLLDGDEDPVDATTRMKEVLLGRVGTSA